ncbi:N-acetylmuramoyl-L-alanine amidase [Paenibacillus illinoisensis]|uniref:N-acetylmuramoyl-L-alanine amidase n=1 Tax=Paenibacillus illinoisensis TaxID=59845 RepID=UPI00203EF55A|nr:N-acetylmuramoyl-L-alanine amidase [Paenibacillus illinoisensis]MCM3206374.1 N-acetylmuramoyl-L-alanine amidase [Paenibacillus illinoisensis]
MYKVWIDAGHGGKDPGAVANGIQEKDIALKISLGIKERLEEGYEDVQVLLSRSADVFLELKDRTRKANAAGADILVSIHCNAGGGKGGFESFRYTSASQNSIKLQNVLHKAIVTKLGGIDRGKKKQNLHMVRESKMPAVLTENLFVDVAADSDRLKQAGVIDAIIDGHIQGIVTYLGLAVKESKLATEITAIVNGKEIEGAVLNNGTVLIPLRTAGDNIPGATINWDQKTKTATLETR